MCIGGGGGGNQIAERAEKADNERQARVERGMAQLQAIFGGGKIGKNPVKDWLGLDPGASAYTNGMGPPSPNGAKTYYDSLGNPVQMLNEQQAQAKRPGSYIPQIEDWNELIGKGLYTEAETTAGFNDDFYDKTYKAQLAADLPEVDDQFADAQKQLTYALARQGISASSMAGQLQGNLQGERSKALQQVENRASGVRDSQMRDVESERAELTRLLQTTGDADATATMAQNATNRLRSAPKLEAIGPLFQNATGTLADVIGSPYLRQQMTGQDSKGYGGSGGSGKVIRS
jgi:hypothetical protein